jgi:Carboxypeptidase regulatory-like domain/Domain of unknown function (DUF4382)
MQVLPGGFAGHYTNKDTKRMNRSAIVSLAGLIALSACSGGGSTGNPAHNVSPSSVKLAPFTIPSTTSPAALKSESAAKAKRKTKDFGDGTGFPGGTPTFTGDMEFLDAPNFGPGAQINLAIVGVQAMSAGTAYDLVTYDTAVVINTLDFQRESLVLGSNNLPAQSYDGVRLMIDTSQSNVVSNGQTYPMTFGSFDPSTHAFQASSATVASFDVAMPFDGTAGSVHLLMDFNAVDSIALVNGVAQVGPALVGTNGAHSAVIAGSVVNNAGAPVSSATVQAIRPDGSVAATTESANDGSFELHAIRSGSYQVVISNNYVTRHGHIITSSNADTTDALPGIPVTIPDGYRADLGQVKD